MKIDDDSCVADINDIMSPEELKGYKLGNRPAIKLSSIRTEVKQQRNDLCLCGSGLKYKHCCINK